MAIEIELVRMRTNEVIIASDLIDLFVSFISGCIGTKYFFFQVHSPLSRFLLDYHLESMEIS